MYIHRYKQNEPPARRGGSQRGKRPTTMTLHYIVMLVRLIMTLQWHHITLMCVMY